MSGPSVVVERAPDGWTHIGGPGMHLLIGIDEDDERTIAASDAADGGDVDDVLEVLTAGGMRKAQHFVGVHWKPRTRIVAFGPVSALVTLADGTEHDLRATSTKVWTDVELPEHPESVVLRVLEESERSQPAPPQSLGAAPASAGATQRPDDAPLAEPEDTGTETAAGGTETAAAGGIGRSDGSSGPGASSRSPWDRSWARRDTPSASASSDAAAAPRPEVAAAPQEPADASTPERPALTAPVADDLPSVAARDVDSTWAGRPVLEPAASSPAAATPANLPAPAPTPTAPGRPPADETDDAPPAVLPSYDYLFGHTTTADEHRKALAQLTQPADDEGAADDDDHLPVPIVADVSDVPVTHAAPAPEVPDRPVPSAPTSPDLPEPSGGGLISSVPWASPAPVATRSGPPPEVPTFTGRHTPPPAPSLLPPMNTPPPGVRAPEATPLISTGPPPAPAAPTVPGAPTAYAPSVSTEPEPSFDVPLSPPASLPPAVPPARPTPAPIPAPTEAAGLADDEDETELTVDRSALLEARTAAQNQAISGPSVLAVLCSTGHPTPPHSDRCRVCGSSIPPQEPFPMPRPPLGVLRLSTGDVVTLDRSVLLGRAPRLGDGLAAHDRPHVVKVPSPERDVSRNHVEVILEGWHVLIRDLGTTNGTTVTLPGESPVRLRANDQQVLEPGSFVSMADEVSFTFEAAL